ncbi:MAG: glycosyltransferase [Agriterribacter sp.]
MKVFFLTLNSFSQIPVTRYIIKTIANNFYSEILQATIEGQYKIPHVKKEQSLGVFKNSNELNSQSYFLKIKKHFLIFKKLFSICYISNPVIYTPDLQIAFYSLLIKKNFKKDLKILYHQFEVINPHIVSKLVKYQLQYAIKNSDRIDLILFPEIHRKNIFVSGCSNPENINAFVFPNTCESRNEVELSKHSLNSIPDSAVIIAHIGNVGTDHYFEQFIKMVENSKHLENLFFVVVGRHSNEIIERFKTINNKNFILNGEIPHSQLSNIYTRIDYGLILYKGVDLNFEYCAPNKLYEYWSYGIPVFAPKLKGLVSLFDTPIKGRLIDFEDNALQRLCEELAAGSKPVKKDLQKLFAEKLSIEVEIEKLKSTIEKVIYES